jgi:protein-S-isoprenylcysteine O-methyltransferase Ste14
MEKRESKVRDLVEKLEAGELTRQETLRMLEERGIKHRENWWEFLGAILWGILCFLPAVARLSNLEIVNLFLQVATIRFPLAAIYLARVLVVLAICMEVYVVYWRMRRGGLRSEDDTIVLLKEGPHRIVRHPSGVDWAIGGVAITVAISECVPFTILSVVGNALWILYLYRASVVEERELNLKKWGDEYRRYMQEVPRFNFIKGLWNLRTSGKHDADS